MKEERTCIVLGIIGVLFFASAMIIPVYVFPIGGLGAVLVSPWALSPVGTLAAIALVAAAASLPVWRSTRRSWIAPLAAGVAAKAMAITVLVYEICSIDLVRFIRYSQISIFPLLAINDGSKIFVLYPILSLTISFWVLLVESRIARRSKVSPRSGKRLT
jgi:hypothetical protein